LEGVDRLDAGLLASRNKVIVGDKSHCRDQSQKPTLNTPAAEGLERCTWDLLLVFHHSFGSVWLCLDLPPMLLGKRSLDEDRMPPPSSSLSELRVRNREDAPAF